jgi:hypothetical protein
MTSPLQLVPILHQDNMDEVSNAEDGRKTNQSEEAQGGITYGKLFERVQMYGHHAAWTEIKGPWVTE